MEAVRVAVPGATLASPERVTDLSTPAAERLTEAAPVTGLAALAELRETGAVAEGCLVTVAEELERLTAELDLVAELPL